MNQSVFRHNVAVFDAMIRTQAPEALGKDWVLWMLNQIKQSKNPINSDWVSASHNITGKKLTFAGFPTDEPDWNPPVDYDSWGEDC